MKPGMRILSLLVFVALAWAIDHTCYRFLDPYQYLILILIGINVILAVSLNLITGFTGQFSLGHAGFMSVGAYAAASASIFLRDHASGISSTVWGQPLVFVLALLLGGLAAGGAGLLVGIPTLRLRGDYLAIATLGFGEIIRILFVNMEAVGGPRGLIDIPNFAELRTPGGTVVASKLFWVLLCASATVWVIRNMVRCTKGRAFLCIRDDETAAEAIGIHLMKYKVVAFLVGAFFAGMAGGLFAHHQLYINPDDFKFMKSVEVVVMMILGGLGSITGSILAAVALTILPEFLRQVGDYRLVLYALMLIVLMLVRPQGLLGNIRWIWPWQWFGRARKEKGASHGSV